MQVALLDPQQSRTVDSQLSRISADRIQQTRRSSGPPLIDSCSGCRAMQESPTDCHSGIEAQKVRTPNNLRALPILSFPKAYIHSIAIRRRAGLRCPVLVERRPQAVSPEVSGLDAQGTRDRNKRLNRSRIAVLNTLRRPRITRGCP